MSSADLANSDVRRLKMAVLWSRVHTVATVAFLVLDAASLFGAFAWSSGILRFVVLVSVILHGLCLAAVCDVVSSRRSDGFLKGAGFLAVATTPGASLGFVAYYVGAVEPTKITLPLCLFLIMVASWGGASVARGMLAQDAPGQSAPHGGTTSGHLGVAPLLPSWAHLVLPFGSMMIAGAAFNHLTAPEPGWTWWVAHGLLFFVAWACTYGAAAQSFRLLSCVLLAASNALLAACVFSSVVLVNEVWGVWGVVGGVVASVLLGFLPASYLVFIPMALIALATAGTWETVLDVGVVVLAAVALRWGNVDRPVARAL